MQPVFLIPSILPELLCHLESKAEFESPVLPHRVRAQLPEQKNLDRFVVDCTPVAEVIAEFKKIYSDPSKVWFDRRCFGGGSWRTA